MFKKILNILYISIGLYNSDAFFAPSVKLASGKKVNLIGNGPPLLFSTGLFGTMPRSFYNEFINNIKKNYTVITTEGLTRVDENTIDEVCEALNVDKISYLSHSSFLPEVLDSDKINSAVLIDPINIPWISFQGLTNPIIKLNFPTLIIKAEKLYSGSKTLPEWQDPEFKGDYNEEVIDNVGHPDILDNTWANIAKNIGLWEMANGEKMNYSNWQYNMRSEIPNIRKKYRKNIAHKIINFIN
tara:strand:- start:512 stop:1237 length:726 start_codon:yes stop_codon:yes gene_type:complete